MVSIPKQKSKFSGMVIKPEDDGDGHTRITNSDHFVTIGGNEEEHAKITEISVRVEEGMKKDGKRPHEVSDKEFFDRLDEAIDKAGE